MTEGTLNIHFHGHPMILHAEGAIWWPETGSLILSDVHLGKSATFRAHGIPIPEGEATEDLERILALVDSLRPTTLLILGDFIHSSSRLAPEFEAQLGRWLDSMPCRVELVLGNHDPSAAHLRGLKGLHCSRQIIHHGVTLVHDPADAPAENPAIAGHLHPLLTVGGKRGPKTRVPGFFLQGHTLILPAFGTFTSGCPIDLNQPDSSFHPIIDRRVHAAIKPVDGLNSHNSLTRKLGP